MIWSLEEGNREVDSFLKCGIIINLYYAQNHLKRVWIDELPRYEGGFAQIDVVPWALKEGFAEEFKVNGRSRLLLTRSGRQYFESKSKKFVELYDIISS